MNAPTVLYGGTFDPIHNGHLAVAEAVAAALAAEVALLPAADPPHRARPGADAEHRAAMVALAIDRHPRLRLDRRELQRAGASYTFDTLLEVRAEIGPAASLVWVLGADALSGLASWHRWRELLQHAHLLAFERAEHPLDADAFARRAPDVAAELLPRRCECEALPSRPAGGFVVLRPARPLPESATEVRRRIREGGDWQACLAPAVAGYVTAHGLYRAAGV